MESEMALTDSGELLVKLELTEEQLNRVKIYYWNKPYKTQTVVYNDGEIVIYIKRDGLG
jgi:hypothetical protein